MNLPAHSHEPENSGNAAASSRASGRTMMRKRFEEVQAAPTAEKPAEVPVLQPERDPMRGRRLGEILIAMGVLNAPLLKAPEAEARMSKEFLGQVLMRRALVTPMQLCEALSIQSGLPMLDLTGYTVPAWTLKKIPLDTMIKNEFVPFADDERAVYLAAKRPLNPLRVAELEKLVERPIDVRLAPDHQIATMLNLISPRRVQQKRRHERLATAMPAWLQVCDERGDNVSTSLSNTQTVDISEAGFRIEVPEAVYATLSNSRRKDIYFRVRISLPPHNVLCICALRYMKRKEQVKPWEMPWLLGLHVSSATAPDRENLKQICTRVSIQLARTKMLED